VTRGHFRVNDHPSLRHVAAGVIVAMGCWYALPLAPVIAQQASRPAGWDETSHGSRARPDYDRVFSLDRVHDLHITIAPDRFRAMQEDLRSVLPTGMGRGGPFPGAGRGAGAPGGGNPLEGLTAACREKKPTDACTVDGVAGQCTELPFVDAGLACVPGGLGGGFARGRGRGAPNLTTRDPMYVPVDLTYAGRTWTQVGMRYKGNSSLMSANPETGGKIPFRLDFDRYEDQYPAIRNQRFYGFQKLTFASNVGDDTQLNEALAVEVFRDRGVPAARAAFYRVYVDTGSGPEYWGLYTMIEDPADGAMLDAQLGGSGGNLYKPEGFAANWSLPFDAESFGKKTNEKAADFSDVQGAVTALHAPRDDARMWRAALEARFDVDLFLQWLAVNTVIQNWDAYGGMPHNYYLYSPPKGKGQLRWIPWDHNFAFGGGPMGGGRGFGRGGPGGPGGFGPGARGGDPNAQFPPPAGGGFPGFGGPGGRGGRGGPGGGDVLHSQVGENWPLIQRLLSDEVYAARYRAALERALEGLLAPETFERRARALHALISSAVLAERPNYTTISSVDGFKTSLDGPGGLIASLRARQDEVRTALAQARPR
jgi:spore coat protein H